MTFAPILQLLLSGLCCDAQCNTIWLSVKCDVIFNMESYALQVGLASKALVVLNIMEICPLEQNDSPYLQMNA